jgi:ionotropic glutamate receptor
MIHWLKNNLPYVDKCLAKSNESARQKPIKLVDLTSAFFILGIGVSLALLSFLTEVFYFRF